MWLWILALALFAVAALSLYMAFQNPAFIAGLGAIIGKAAIKKLEEGVQPRDFTPEEREKIRMGENPFQQGREK
jgi:hypothetical protein